MPNNDSLPSHTPRPSCIDNYSSPESEADRNDADASYMTRNNDGICRNHFSCLRKFSQSPSFYYIGGFLISSILNVVSFSANVMLKWKQSNERGNDYNDIDENDKLELLLLNVLSKSDDILYLCIWSVIIILLVLQGDWWISSYVYHRLITCLLRRENRNEEDKQRLFVAGVHFIAGIVIGCLVVYLTLTSLFDVNSLSRMNRESLALLELVCIHLLLSIILVVGFAKVVVNQNDRAKDEECNVSQCHKAVTDEDIKVTDEVQTGVRVIPSYAEACAQTTNLIIV